MIPTSTSGDYDSDNDDEPFDEPAQRAVVKKAARAASVAAAKTTHKTIPNVAEQKAAIMSKFQSLELAKAKALAKPAAHAAPKAPVKAVVADKAKPLSNMFQRSRPIQVGKADFVRIADAEPIDGVLNINMDKLVDTKLKPDYVMDIGYKLKRPNTAARDVDI
ncbi:hypothetical protein FBU59_006705 [Linderina macrospora]|uniref:Uncharacterized protein n=1 Tax=Linderina macrospora TaxID=4868 RepID=A0ACC1IZ26_9FUNG|nr:hypothetical protein FBU59_006705 [Linderina macrospora]